MQTIAFHGEQLCVRGTSTALYDYARYNEELLGNRSIIVVPFYGIGRSAGTALDRFSARFRIRTYTDKTSMEKVLSDEKCSVLYCIKYGKRDDAVSDKIKTVIHCVFDMSEPHGDVYAAVSQQIAQKFKQKSFVPHMIGLKPSTTDRDTFRTELQIPLDATVFGRYGGRDTFDLEFCKQAICRIVTERKDVFFLFMNTDTFVVHPRVIYMDSTSNDHVKSSFISACDAHIECGRLGHTFGLAIGEFSVNNKPIIAYRMQSSSASFWNDAHITILGDKGLYYSNEEEFYKILSGFRPSDFTGRDLNCYRDYSPEKVMKQFQEVFLTDKTDKTDKK